MVQFGYRQRGSALLLALVVIVFALIVGATFARSAVVGKSMAADERQLSQAYYVAESGLTEVIARPDTYITPYVFQNNTFVDRWDSDKDKPFGLPGHDDSLTFDIEFIRLRDGVYEIRSIGHTPYATAMAAAEVKVIPLGAQMFDSVFHMGGLGVPLTVPGTPGEGHGNPSDVNYHFRGADAQIYGSLQFETDNGTVLQTPRTFNIWGPVYNSRTSEKFETWNNHPPESTDYIPLPYWLEEYGKHGPLDEDALPDDVADKLYKQLRISLPAVWTERTDDWSKMRLQVGTELDSSSPKPGAVLYEETLSNNAYIDGLGHLHLTSDNGFVIKELTLRGDLTIWVNSDIQIDRIRPIEGTPSSSISTTGEHRLVIVSEGSIEIGGRSSTYDPYPWFGQDLQPLFLHNGSVLWARHNLVIQGQVRAGLPKDYTASELADGPIFTYPNDVDGEPVYEPDESPAPRGSIALISRGVDGVSEQYSLTAHTIDGQGLVYAGDRVKVFRVRLTGAAYVLNPFQLRLVRDKQVVGLSELYLTAGDPGILTELGGQKLYIEVVRRTK